MNENDRKFLLWLADRLDNVHSDHDYLSEHLRRMVDRNRQEPVQIVRQTTRTETVHYGRR